MSRRRTDPSVDRPIHRGLAPRWRGNRVFYVAVEGEATEPDYLAYLNREYGAELGFLIHPLHRRNGMTPRQVVARALEFQDEATGSGGSRVQLWALFDRDQHPDVIHAMRNARAKGVRVAFSHPSFDLWLLLHFTDISGKQDGSGRIIHEKLRRYEGFATFGSQHGKHVLGSRVEALRGRHHDADRRARRLVDSCPLGQCSSADDHAQQCDPLRRDPSTDVWRLLSELGIVDA